MKVRNTFIIFLVSGFWHGANWTFIVWGGLNALYFLPLLLLKRNRTNLGVVAEGRILPSLRELWQMGTTFLLTLVAWIFFRAESVAQASEYIYQMIFTDLFISPDLDIILRWRTKLPPFLIMFIFFLTQEWLGRYGKYGIEKSIIKNKVLKYLFCLFIFISIFLLGGNNLNSFIYFQF